jgi:CubicO group peptidase (beta-lactamase class C family)
LFKIRSTDPISVGYAIKARSFSNNSGGDNVTELEQAIQAIEHGLLKVTQSNKPATKRMDLLQRMEHYKVPGFSAAFVNQDELAWAKGFGVVEAGSKKPVTDDTIFQAASISKPFTAMIALHLVEAGLLDLDADANEFLHSWKIPKSKHTQAVSDGVQRNVTLRGLLSHTAGMNIFGYPGYSSGSELPTLHQVLNGEPPATSKPVRVVNPPGTEFNYSSGGYLVAQQMIEDVTSKPLAVMAKEIIFDKLGMTSSTFNSKLPEKFILRAVTAHGETGEPIPGKWHVYPEQAAASLWSTPTDLARLIIEVLKSLNNESNLVLSAEMTRQMLIPEIGMGGLGFNIIIKDGMTRFGHPGWNEGFHNMLIGCPETGQGIIWMTNGENGRHLGHEVSRGLAEIVRFSWW